MAGRRRNRSESTWLSQQNFAALALLSVGSACSFGAADRRSVEVALPSELVQQAKLREAVQLGPRSTSGSRSASTQALSIAYTSLADFKCFGMIVAGTDLTPHPKAGSCKTYSIISGLISATQSKPSFNLQVPAGENREFILFGLTSSGDCPAIDDILYERINFSTISEPYILGRTKTSISSDTTISIKASFNPSTSEKIVCATPSTTSTATSTATSTTTSSTTGSSTSSSVTGGTSIQTLTLSFTSTLPSTLSSINPITVTGLITGTNSVSQLTVSFYSGGSCSGSPLGSASGGDFTGGGVRVTLTSNSTSYLYARVAPPSSVTTMSQSACTHYGIYQHDGVAPSSITDITISGAYRGTGLAFYHTSTLPVFRALVEADVSTISLYNHGACTGTALASGTKSQLDSSGISFSAAANSPVNLYALLTDRAGNNSTCLAVGSYLADTTAPSDPSSVSIGSTPRSTISSPTISWNASSDTGVGGVNYVLRIFDTFSAQNVATVNISATTYTFTGLALTAGHGLTAFVTARDALGNSSNEVTAGSWTVQDLATQLTASGFGTAPVIGECLPLGFSGFGPDGTTPKYVAPSNTSVTYSGPAATGIRLYSDSNCSAHGIVFPSGTATHSGWIQFNQLSSGALTLSVGDLSVATTITPTFSTANVIHKLGTTTPGAGSADGLSTLSSVSMPWDFAEVPSEGKIFYTDSAANKIRAITPNHPGGWWVSGFAGDGTPSDIDGTGTGARISNPSGITTDGTYLYVAQSTHLIRRIHIASQAVMTLAGDSGASGSTSSTSGIAARFNTPNGIVYWPGTGGAPNRLIVADQGNHQLRLIHNPETNTVTVSNLAGDGTGGWGDSGSGTNAQFNGPRFLAMSEDNSSVYVTENSCIREVSLSGTYQVSTRYGHCANTGTLADGNSIGGNTVAFNNLAGIKAKNGYLYVSDRGNYRIVKINLSTNTLYVVGSGNGSGWDAAYGLSVGEFGVIFGHSGLYRIYGTRATP